MGVLIGWRESQADQTVASVWWWGTQSASLSGGAEETTAWGYWLADENRRQTKPLRATWWWGTQSASLSGGGEETTAWRYWLADENRRQTKPLRVSDGGGRSLLVWVEGEKRLSHGGTDWLTRIAGRPSRCECLMVGVAVGVSFALLLLWLWAVVSSLEFQACGRSSWLFSSLHTCQGSKLFGEKTGEQTVFDDLSFPYSARHNLRPPFIILRSISKFNISEHTLAKRGWKKQIPDLG